MNSGRCIGSPGRVNFVCDCRGTGFTGTLCQADVDECSLQLHCNGNGRCENTLGSFTCSCNDGFSGPACSFVVESVEAPQSESNIALYAGLGGAFLAAILVSIAVAMHCNRQAESKELAKQQQMAAAVEAQQMAEQQLEQQVMQDQMAAMSMSMASMGSTADMFGGDPSGMSLASGGSMASMASMSGMIDPSMGY